MKINYEYQNSNKKKKSNQNDNEKKEKQSIFSVLKYMNLLKIHIEISNFNFFLINKYMKI